MWYLFTNGELNFSWKSPDNVCVLFSYSMQRWSHKIIEMSFKRKGTRWSLEFWRRLSVTIMWHHIASGWIPFHREHFRNAHIPALIGIGLVTWSRPGVSDWKHTQCLHRYLKCCEQVLAFFMLGMLLLFKLFVHHCIIGKILSTSPLACYPFILKCVFGDVNF